VTEGVRHIAAGFDHLTFLLLLVLPLAFRGSYKERFIAVVGVVTAFTIAHSITLALSSLGHLSLPAGPFEVLIAASVIVAAGMNILGVGRGFAWPVAYVFGLLHGLGFAGAFKELAAGIALNWTDLLAFNLGVEIGQVAFIAVVLLGLGAIADPPGKEKILVPLGSAVAGFAGAVWILQRF